MLLLEFLPVFQTRKGLKNGAKQNFAGSKIWRAQRERQGGRESKIAFLLCVGKKVPDGLFRHPVKLTFSA